MVWRVGVVPYLNADPLTAALRQRDAALLVGDSLRVEALVPSRLIQVLLDGELDVALVSAAAVLPQPELRILPGMCISSRESVRSITLYCRKPLDQVQTVALDSSSRSGLNLTRVLFAERWQRTPEYVIAPPDLGAMLHHADAALLIGNPALLANEDLDSGRWTGPPVEQCDLGAEWFRMTGLPFVYAVWAAATRLLPSGGLPDLERLGAALLRAKAWGIARIDSLAARGAEELRLPLPLVKEYLTYNIRYNLGEEERAGMELFCKLAVRHRILPEASAVRFAFEG